MTIPISCYDRQTVVDYKNGATFIARQHKGAEQVEVYSTMFSAGTMVGSVGAAHLLEHCKSKPSIRDDIERARGRITAFAGFSGTSFGGHIPKEHAELLIEGVGTAMSKDDFSEDLFDYEQEEVRTECANDSMSEQWGLWKRWYNAILSPNPLGRFEGYADIDALTYEGVQQFHQENYSSNNLVVAIEGPHEPQEMIEHAKKHFILPEGLTSAVNNFAFQPSTIKLPQKEAIATQVNLLFKHPSNSYDPIDHFLYRVARTYLSSVIFFNTKWDRKKPLAREIQNIGVSPDGSFFTGGYAFTVQSKNVVKTIEAIAKTIQSGFEASERSSTIMNNTLNRLKKEALKKTSPVGASNLVNSAYRTGKIHSPNQLKETLSSITPQDIENTIQKIFLNSNCSLVYLGHIDNSYLSHEETAKLFRNDSLPKRGAETNQRLLSQACNFSLRHE